MEQNLNNKSRKIKIIQRGLFVIVSLVLIYSMNFVYTHTLPGNRDDKRPVQTFIFNEIQYDISNITGWKLFNGFITMYYKNGKLKGITRFKNGQRDGFRKMWFENGQIEFEIPFKKNQLHGILTQWYNNGNKKTISSFVKGKLDGMTYIWHENGQLGIEVEYRQNKINGLYRKWNQNGKIIFEEKYVDGIKQQNIKKEVQNGH